MAKQDSRGAENGAPMGKQETNPAEPSAAQKKEDDREIDHRGVVMPRRARIGGIIMPQ